MCTLEFQIERVGEITGRLENFGQNNKREGCNKRGDWQKYPKLINGEVGINGEAAKKHSN